MQWFTFLHKHLLTGLVEDGKSFRKHTKEGARMAVKIAVVAVLFFVVLVVLRCRFRSKEHETRDRRRSQGTESVPCRSETGPPPLLHSEAPDTAVAGEDCFLGDQKSNKIHTVESREREANY